MTTEPRANTLNSYQAAAWEVSTHPLNEAPHTVLEYAALGLCGEAGELANIVKKEWRREGALHAARDVATKEYGPNNEAYERLIDEAGDVLWYLAMFASVAGITLGEVARRNLDKLRARGKTRNGLNTFKHTGNGDPDE